MTALRRPLAAFAVCALPGALAAQPGARPLWRSDAFVVTDTSVRQGAFEAVAPSRDSLVSTWPRAAREVHYKFALNGQDNEFAPGTEHVVHLRPTRGGALVTPVHAFGVPSPATVPEPVLGAQGDDGAARLTVRLDLRPVLQAIRETGRYVPPNGAPLTRLEHAYVIGDVAPLTWDAAALRPGMPQELTDADGDGIYEATIAVATDYTRPLRADGRAAWGRTLDLQGFPQLASPERLLDATYQLSLEELRQVTRPDGALQAGAKWPGVWTRDVSLAAVLSIALVAPDAVRRSLLHKVDAEGRIIQDTGTGGSWPVSTDRTTWALAAWELFLVTGDRAWLRQAHDVIARSVAADRHAALDPATGLLRGESSFLDWREQSYPRWMQPADIYQGQALGTNAVHHGAYRILARMARLLGEPAAPRWDAMADAVRDGVNRTMWQPALGWYGQYRYGRTALALSPRAEGLGAALAVLYDVAPEARRATVVRRTPVLPFGTPSFWPSIPGEPYYHNGTVWPFVTAFWTWAAAEAGNTAAVEHGLANLVRTPALFLTNKENFVARTGHFEGTALNNDRQLWSTAGTLAATYRILFGVRLAPDRLMLRPMVPPSYGGVRTLTGLRWRAATLTLVVRGHGRGVRRAWLDGRPLERAELPATLAGAHTVELELDGRWPRDTMHLVDDVTAPATPSPTLARDAAGRDVAGGDRLAWPRVPGAVRYELWRDGLRHAATTDTVHAVRPAATLAEWQVLAVDARGVASFLSEPVRVVAPGAEVTVKPDAGLEQAYDGQPLTGFTGAGHLPLEAGRHTTVTLTVQVPRGGVWALDARYANGSGPINTEDKVAVRTVRVDGRAVGVLVMPQRGTGRWSSWGWTNPLVVPLTAGRHVVTLTYEPHDRNMHGRVSTALLDHVRLTPLGAGR